MNIKILFYSIIIGVLQVVLSRLANVHLQQLDSKWNLIRYGYLDTYYWSLTHILLIPIMLNFGIPSIMTLKRISQSSQEKKHYYKFVLLTFIAIVFTIITALREMVNRYSFVIINNHGLDYLQWNQISTYFSQNNYHSTTLSKYSHYILFFVCYINYAIVYSIFFMSVIGIFLFFVDWFFWKNKKTRNLTLKLNKNSKKLLLYQQIIVSCYLTYLTLLRSSKVSLLLSSQGKQVTIANLTNFAKTGQSYLEAVTPGLFINIGLGFAWIILIFFTHILAWNISNENLEIKSEHNLFMSIKGGYNLVGRWFKVISGICIISIIVPPPSLNHLLLIGMLLVSSFLIRSGMK